MDNFDTEDALSDKYWEKRTDLAFRYRYLTELGTRVIIKIGFYVTFFFDQVLFDQTFF